MEYRISVDQHDSTICTEIGKAAGQVAGGWSIGHRQEGDEIILVLPSDVITEAQIKTVLDAHDWRKAKDPSEKRRERIESLRTKGRNNWTADDRAELLELLAEARW